MDTIPAWLIDAVAAAGLATVYADQFDTLVQYGVRITDAKLEAGASY
jgi:hypothetical protein